MNESGENDENVKSYGIFENIRSRTFFFFLFVRTDKIIDISLYDETDVLSELKVFTSSIRYLLIR